MNEDITKFISRRTFWHYFTLWSRQRYSQFVEVSNERLNSMIDKQTSLNKLSIKNSWKDGGGNTHISIGGIAIRGSEQAKVRAEIVWLKNLKIFRGNFWSDLTPKSEIELFNEAKSLFHQKKYAEFLTISRIIEVEYSKNKIYSKMRAIAESRV